MCQSPCGGRNADKGLSDGLERIGGEPSGFHGAVDRTAAEREPIGRLSGREVPVSYTHLDVYKRQGLQRPLLQKLDMWDSWPPSSFYLP